MKHPATIAKQRVLDGFEQRQRERDERRAEKRRRAAAAHPKVRTGRTDQANHKVRLSYEDAVAKPR